jgi:hypothetical protein
MNPPPVTTETATSGSVNMTVGYTDPVIAIAEWPSTTLGWSVQASPDGGAGANLMFQVAMQSGGMIPGGTAPGDAAAASAVDVATRFASIWYQVMQPEPDITASLATSLNQPAGGDPIDMPVELDGLRRYVSGGYAFCVAAGKLMATVADPATTATLADVVTHYGVDWQALGLASGERAIGTLVGVPTTGLNIPSFAVFVAGGTVKALVPAGLNPATVLADPDNIVLPLNPGVELVVTSAEQAQPHDSLPLSKLAGALNITPASLVTANRTRPALLAPGFVFVAQGVEVEVPATGEPGADATLEDIAQTFRTNGVPYDAVMAAVANADAPGIFRSGVTLVVDRQIVVAGWTLDDNDTGIETATLAADNIDTLDLFPASTPVFLKTTAVTGLENAPLGATARAYAIEPGDLLRHNAGLAPCVPDATTGAGLPVPGLAALPPDRASLRVPYRIGDGKTMTDIAALFVSAARNGSGLTAEEALTEANCALPGTVVGGRTITVNGQALPTQAGDSFNDVIGRADPPVTITQFADAIADDADALVDDALLLCPPAKLPGGAGVTPDTLSTAYGLDATKIMSANAATEGAILSGVTLKPSPTADMPTVESAVSDSMNAIIRRFAAAGASVTIGDVVQANLEVAFLAPEAMLLLPPADAQLSTNFGASGWQIPDVIFPLRSWITLSRNSELVDPAFRGPAGAPGPAERASSSVAATRNTTPDRQEDGAFTLEMFATAIENTMPGLKLATGRVLSAERDPAPTDVWAISFIDPGGITEVNIVPTATVPGVDGPQPLSFALRPLSNTLESENGVQIRSLDPETGGWGSTQTRDYQGIDLEVWARGWLAGLDLICTAPYSAPAYRLAPAPLARLLAAKKLVACAVADGLSPILATQAASGGTIGGAAWTAAREVLYQRLLATLGPAYDITAILQFGATVVAPAAAASARLVGVGKLNDLSASHADKLEVGADPNAWKISQLGNAKTSLAATTAGMISFTFNVTQPSRHRSVAIQPVYAVNEVEFNVTPITGGYDSSNWLSFVRPFDQHPPSAFSADLGDTLVPVPLRAYPDLPVLVSQSAVTATDPTSVDEALHWAYVFTYTHQSAAQDQIRVEIEFNRQPSVSMMDAKEEDTLFKALAQYAAVSDTLWQILSQLQNLDPAPDNTVLANTLETYAGLAERVANLWATWWGVGSCNQEVAAVERIKPAHLGRVPPSRWRAPLADGEKASAPHAFYQYLATLNSATVDNVEVYVSLNLQRLSAHGDTAWPDITVIRDDGKAIPLTATDPVDATRVYSFPAEPIDQVPAFTRIGFRYSIGGLHIANYQNASSAVSVIRNVQLLGPSGPDTCTAFVYSTPQLGFPEPLVPLITFSTRLDLGTWTNTAATNPLTPLFNAIFDGDPSKREIAIGAHYGYTLVASSPPIETSLPVVLRPRFTYDQATTVQSVIDTVESWASEVNPTTTGGLWSFNISFYSSTDPELDRPLLELKNAVSPLT